MTRWTAFDYQMAGDCVMDTRVRDYGDFAILHCEHCATHWILFLGERFNDLVALDLMAHAREHRQEEP